MNLSRKGGEYLMSIVEGMGKTPCAPFLESARRGALFTSGDSPRRGALDGRDYLLPDDIRTSPSRAFLTG